MLTVTLVSSVTLPILGTVASATNGSSGGPSGALGISAEVCASAQVPVQADVCGRKSADRLAGDLTVEFGHRHMAGRLLSQISYTLELVLDVLK